jgi:hypothetical protein
MTATEFLIEYCDRENWSIPNNILEQAKEMEKEQLESAYLAGEAKDKQYYNETFKNTEK